MLKLVLYIYIYTYLSVCVCVTLAVVCVESRAHNDQSCQLIFPIPIRYET